MAIRVRSQILIEVISKGFKKLRRDMNTAKKEFRGFSTVGEMATKSIKDLNTQLGSYQRRMKSTLDSQIKYGNQLGDIKSKMGALGLQHKKGIITTNAYNNSMKKLKNTQGMIGEKVRTNIGRIKAYKTGITNAKKQITKFGAETKITTKKMDVFHAELLSLMFFGMALSAVMSGLMRPALEAFGVFTIWGAALTVLFIPLMDILMPFFLRFTDWLMELPNSWKIAIGGSVLFLLILGKLIMALGMLGLAWFGFTQIRFTMPVSLKLFKNAFMFLPGIIGKVITKMTKFIGLSKGLKLAAGTGAARVGAARGLAGMGMILGPIGLLLALPALKKAWDENLFGIQDKVKAFREWFKNIDWHEIWNNIITSGKEILDVMTGMFNKIDWKGLWENLTKALSIVTADVKELFNKMFDKIRDWYSSKDWGGNWENIFKWTTKIIGYVGTFVSKLFNSLKEKVSATNWSDVFVKIFKLTTRVTEIIVRFAGILIGTLLSSLIKFVKALPDIMGMIWDVITGQKRARAKFFEGVGGKGAFFRGIGREFLRGFTEGFTALGTGGIVTRPTAALIGEHGSEAVIPLSKMGELGTTNITINNPSVRNDSDITAIANEVDRVLEEKRRRFR